MSDRRYKFFLVLILTALPILIAAPLARADNLYASIRGTATDPAGAVLPGVQITATNTGTGISYHATSSADGSYQFLQLPIGGYKVVAEGNGFKTVTTSGITLVLDQIYVLPVRMKVGAATETITVEAHPVQVESSSNQLGTVIEGKKIVDLPLVARNWVQLQQLQPGVVGSSDRFGDTYATNGSQAQQNSYLIDGIDNNDITLNTPLTIPSPDAISEFNMVTNTINAEYGRNSGAVLNAAIKSGGNAFHGSAFEFYRDTFLNSKNYFSLTPDVFHQNLFGGTIGGPIWKNKTFFFFSYQGGRSRQQDNNTLLQNGGIPTVFTPDQLNGVFPDIASSGGVSPIPMVGENGVRLPAGTPYSTLFPTGHVPVTNFNQISKNLVAKFVPLPNFTDNQYSFNPIVNAPTDQEIFRFDHTIDAKNSLWGTGFLEHAPTVSTLPFLGANLPGFGETDDSHTKQFTIAYNHTFSGSMLNEARVGYSRQNFNAVFPTTPAQPSSFGFTGISPQLPSGASLPLINITGLFTLGFTTNGPQPRKTNTYQFTDNFSKVAGRHNLKFGFEMRRFAVFNPFAATNSGLYNFGGNGPFSTSNPGLDFLLGIPDSYGQGSGDTIDARTQEYYTYAQDQFKLRPNLTLNYGVGWQIDTPLKDIFNHGVAVDCFVPGQQSTVFPSAPTGVAFPGDKGCNSAGGPTTSFAHFGPRFGFAYSPDWEWLTGGPDKFSIRGGYGIYFNRGEEELALQNVVSPPFSTSSAGAGNFGGVPSFANPYTTVNTVPITIATANGPKMIPAGSVSSPFPFNPPAVGSSPDFSPFLPLTFNIVDPNFQPAYSQNFNLTVQRELPSHLILSVGYVGAQGRHEQIAVEANPITPAGAAACAADAGCVDSRNAQHAAFPSHSLYPGDTFASLGKEASFGNSNYNSLQVSINKAATHGLSFLTSYTYGHSRDMVSSFENGDRSGVSKGTNPFNPKLDYADSNFDARHRMVVSFNYEVPSFRKIPGLGFMPEKVTGGWRLGGIETLQSGLPIVIRDTGFTSLTCDQFSFYGCWDLPNRVGALTTFDPRRTTLTNNNDAGSGTPKRNYFFNPNSFAPAAIGTIGNAGRNPFHGPGINNTDLILAKATSFTESVRLELRLEAFNAFNHTQFRNPSGNIASPNFGRVLSAESPRRVQLGAKIYF